MINEEIQNFVHQQQREQMEHSKPRLEETTTGDKEVDTDDSIQEDRTE